MSNHFQVVLSETGDINVTDAQKTLNEGTDRVGYYARHRVGLRMFGGQ